MENVVLSEFIEEANGTLAGIRACILTGIHGGMPVDLAGSIGLARSLRSTASLFEDSPFRGGLADLEDRLTEASATGLSGHTKPLEILDLISGIEASIGDAWLRDPSHPFDAAVFVEESFASVMRPADFPAAEPVAEEPAVEETPAEDEFEIDAEMLEIFSAEAGELLDNIEKNLDVLAARPDEKDALWEIRRSAHTFKGAAGIVGLKKPSELAHRVEDLLDRLSETETASNQTLLELLRAASGLLRSMTSGDGPGQYSAPLARLYARFDETADSLFSAEQREAANTTVTEPVPTVPSQSAARPERKSIVRVSLERLDGLVANARELVTTRSVFEQRLADLEQQIDDLHNSTRRLQATCATFEREYESAMLRRTAEPHAEKSGEQGNFDSLELDRYTEFHQSTHQLSETASDAFAISTSIEAVRGNLEDLFRRQRRLIDHLREQLMQIRMVEFSTLATRLQRAVRVTCEEEGKHAEIVIENGELEVDTQILDALVEPLIHLLKNAVVHGIEPPDTRRLLGKPEAGTITIRLAASSTHLAVAVSDDGRGISGSLLREKAVRSGLISAETAARLTPAEQRELIFLPSLTTAEKLNLSAGRGVGMSIVKESIEARNGTIAIDSVLQKGTTFTLRLPLPLPVIKVIVVRGGRQIFAVPASQVREIVAVPTSAICGGHERSLPLNGSDVPLSLLHEIVGAAPAEQPGSGKTSVLFIEASETLRAVAVDEVYRSEEVVIEALKKPLDALRGLIGAAVLGNGSLVPILDLPPLLGSAPKAAPRPQAKRIDKTIVMVVDDSPSVRLTTSKLLESAGYSVATAKDGVDALEKLELADRLPSIILSDLEMPRMDGYELVSTLRSRGPLARIPVIVISSRTSEKHRQKALASGAAHYLTKPYSPAELLSQIKKAVESE